jgi:hypothetical protein
MSNNLDQRIADAERRLAETWRPPMERRATANELDHLNAMKLADAQRAADKSNAQRLAHLGIAPTIDAV